MYRAARNTRKYPRCPDCKNRQINPLPGASNMLVGEIRRVAIIGGNRIPFARANTNYLNVSNQDMLSGALNGLVSRFNLEGKKIDEVVAGAVMKHSKDFNLTRECVLGSKLAPETPAYDIQQACGTGLEAAILAANKIALGQIDSAIAGGVDTTSDAPIAVSDGFRKVLMNANAARSTGDRIKAFMGLRPGHLAPAIPKNGEPRTGLSMGQHMQITANEWGIGQQEQDELTVASHHNLARAYEEGFFDDLITPFKNLDQDNNLRADTSVEKLAKLKPVFAKENGTMTAGNSTPLTDGASVCLLASEQWAEENNLPVLAYLRLGEVAAVDFVDKKEGLLMAPS
ncbi:MAG: acetyl-CoA C-acyltransferase, partial [Gammaproteobacteria bacterium]|nr:acetyl-CoA C-acyltransferase [Gammaproteobacteria bacterium]